jgi:serine/threonine protein kinase
VVLVPGTRLHAYEIVGPIGAGGMGEVYRAHDPRIGRDVAVKVLPAVLSGDPAALARLEREVHAIGALNHPNIVNIFDVGSESGTSFVVMELLEGETLRARLQQGALPRKKALEIAQQIAQGLAAAHARAIVHRDLKPDNVFLTHDGRVKVLDFGLARAVPDGLQQIADTQTRVSPHVGANSAPGLVLGTVGYMAPEQVRGLAVDHRADIFAFGTVLYEMLTGLRAFAGDSPIETMSAILKLDPLEQPGSAAIVGGPIEPLLRHCLEKQPDERFQSARDLAFQLQAIASGSLSTSAARALAGPSLIRRAAVPLAIAIASAMIAIALDRLVLNSSGGADETITLTALLPPDVFLSRAGSPARAGGLAVSRDGRQIVFTGGAIGRNGRLFVRSLDGSVAHEVPGTEGAGYPTWSPDGRRLAFYQGQKLKVISVEGGTAQVIGDMVNPRTAPSWGDDDTLLYHSDYLRGLLRVASSGGVATEMLAAAPPGISWFSPVWLPGARQFLVVRFAYNDDAADAAGIYVVTASSRELSPLIRGRIAEVSYTNHEIVYRRDADLVKQPFDLVTARLSGQAVVMSDHASMMGAGGSTIASYEPPGGLLQGRRLTWFSRNGEIVGYTGEAGTPWDPRLSPDGRALAVARAGENGVYSLWTYDLARSIDTRVSGASHVEPVWSADGRSIYSGGTGHRLERFEPGGDTRGTTVRSVSDDLATFDITPDGRDVLGFLIGKEGSHLVMVAVDGKSDPRPVRHGETPGGAIGNSAALSPDGQWVALQSSAGTRLPRLYAMRLDGTGPRIPITPDAARYPRWRRDGRELYYAIVDGSKLVEEGGPIIVSVPVAWSDGAPDFGRPQPLFRIRNFVGGNFGFDVTTDGQKFVAVATAEPDTTPITVRVRAPSMSRRSTSPR